MTTTLTIHKQLQGTFHALLNDDFTPAFNPGRDDAASWGFPEKEIPEDMASAYDISKGAMVGFTVDDFCKLCKETEGTRYHNEAIARFLKSPQKEIDRQRTALVKHWRKLHAEEEPCLEIPAGIEEGKQTYYIVTYGDAADILEKSIGTPAKVMTVCGQRRTFAWPAVVGLHAAMIDGAEPYNWLFDIRPFESLGNTLFMLYRENAENSKLGYSEVSTFRNACNYLEVDPTVTETELGALLSLADGFSPKAGKIVSRRGLRQKYHRWARIAMSTHPEVKLYDRVAAGFTMKGKKDAAVPAYAAGCKVPVAKLDKEEGACILGDKQTKDDESRIAKIMGKKQKRVATVKEVEALIQALYNSTTKADDTRLSFDDIKLFAVHKMLATKTAVIAEVLQAILDGNKKFFTDK